MSARTLLVDALQAQLPAWRVLGYGDLPDAVRRPTVCLWPTLFEPRREFGAGSVSVQFELWLLTGIEKMDRAENELDSLIEQAFRALAAIDWIDWENAERGVLMDAYQGYVIRITAPHIKIGE